MERGPAIDQAAISGAVERVAARHRARRLGVTEGSLAEQVEALPHGAAQAERGATPTGWLPCGLVYDGVIGEELRVWLRQKDGRVAAKVVRDPPPEPPGEVVSPEGNPHGVRRNR